MSTKQSLTCVYCGKPAEGNFSIHRDGFIDGPEVPLCDACGENKTPTCLEIWTKIKADSNTQKTTPATVNWIACSDQLPDEEKTVLLFSPSSACTSSVFIGWRNGSQYVDCYCAGVFIRALVSHWAELPSGPTEPPDCHEND